MDGQYRRDDSHDRRKEIASCWRHFRAPTVSSSRRQAAT